MSRENPLWGAPRIHGELLKLGIEISEATVSKLVTRHPKPPSQTWRTFIENHVGCLASIDFFVVPTTTFSLLFAFIVLHHDRRWIVHFAVTAHPTAAWVAQQITEAFPCPADQWSASVGYRRGSFPFFNREPDVKLSVLRCRLQAAASRSSTDPGRPLIPEELLQGV